MASAGVPVSLAPDPVIEAYKRDVDVTLLDENLKLGVAERLRKLQAVVEALEKVRTGAGERRERALREASPRAR